MRFSQLFSPTIKEIPAEAETPSHRLMLRAGIIRKLASGIYTYLPLGVKVLEKISAIVREELNRIGSQEVLMPVLHPKELWQQTGRWEKVDVLFRLKDRAERDFLLGPTHEEVITSLVAHEVKSYRQLPLLLYQIQTKFRDEPRPRGGVIRSREFIMMDMYSFHKTKEDLEKTYWKVYEAYQRIYKRSGFTIRVVEGETGDIGGDVSHQFELISQSGEDTLLICPNCSYGADMWRVPCKNSKVKASAAENSLKWNNTPPMEKIETPHVKTIPDLVKSLKKSPQDFIKTLVYEADGKLVFVCLRGDRDVNELKLKRFLRVKKLEMAKPAALGGLASAMGFVGPVNLGVVAKRKSVSDSREEHLETPHLVADDESREMKDAVCGANEPDYHFCHVDYGRDFSIKDENFADLRMAVSGDPCPQCGTALKFENGIELGQIFNLGTIYSKPLNCVYLDEDSSEIPMIMGCYGIGVSRMLASLIEQHHDSDGIIWPVSVAPYDAVIVLVNNQDEKQTEISEKIYQEALDSGLEVVLDDRDVRAGVKFKDADLLGFPFRINVGRGAGEGKVELRDRKTGKSHEINADKAVEELKKMKTEALQTLEPNTRDSEPRREIVSA